MTPWHGMFFCSRQDCESATRVELRGRVWTREWLRALSRDEFEAFSLRAVLSSERGAQDISRISGEAVVERLADLLVSSAVHLHLERPREKLFTGGAQSAPPQTLPAAPPPASRPQASPSPERESDDPETFPTNTSWENQAAVLVAAAASGAPVCYI